MILDRLDPTPDLRHRDVLRGLRWSVREGLFGHGMETLVLGPFLVAFALALGASNLLIGLLAAIPHLVQFGQIPGIYLVEKIRKRRRIAVLGFGSSRPGLLIMASAAFLGPGDLGLALLVLGFCWRYGVASIAVVAWNSWMRDLVPQDVLGRFFASRLTWMTLLGAVVSLAAGGLVDLWRGWWPDGGLYVFPVLMATAFMLGCSGTYCMSRMPEPRMAAAQVEFRFLETLARPFRDDNFRRLILFLGSWNFAVNLAAPFFTVYLLKTLDLDLTLVIALATLSQITNIAVLRLWGRFADRFSNKSVLRAAAPLFVLCIFAWTFTTMPDRHAFTVPLLVIIHALTGIATAGVTLASSNIGLKLAPKGEGAAYLAASSLTIALASAVAPIVGGATADFFAARELSLAIHWTSPRGEMAIEALNFRHWDFFFLFATVLGLYSIHRLALVREVGSVRDRIVVHEFLLATRRGIRNISTIAGLKQMSEFPFELLARAIRRHGARRRHGHDPEAPPSPAARGTGGGEGPRPGGGVVDDG